MKALITNLITLCFFALTSISGIAQDGSEFYPTAIFDFVEKGNRLGGEGEKVSDIIFANLVVEPQLALVDREELEKLEDEATLNLSGMVNSQQANQIGQLTGAKIIVTGTIFEIEDKMMLVAKIIGTETSRVLGASVTGEINDSIFTLTEDLSKKIAETIAESGHTLVATVVEKEDRLADLKEQLKSSNKPSLTISIEEHHISRTVIDPAAETEMLLYAVESGFEVFDENSDSAKQADILIVGEGFTEFATRKGDIVSVKARLEVKAINQRNNEVLAVDRQTELEIDLSEMIASKKALERASAKIAERLLPKIADM